MVRRKHLFIKCVVNPAILFRRRVDGTMAISQITVEKRDKQS